MITIYMVHCYNGLWTTRITENAREAAQRASSAEGTPGVILEVQFEPTAYAVAFLADLAFSNQYADIEEIQDMLVAVHETRFKVRQLVPRLTYVLEEVE